ncbi:MAG: helix-hairpin-helix domain-containing protein [Paracoccaceae bacterium]|nr:helix-hairpin-helix domain-containing protein [Paracoccaceae bacterium]
MAKRRPAEAPGSEENRRIGGMLSDYAEILEQQGEDGFRIRAYRAAASTAEHLDRPLREVWQQGGQDALIALPTIGKGIAAAIAGMLSTGRWPQLERLRGELAPEKLFQTLPGIGPKLARALADEHHLESLEELEAALHDEAVELAGIGLRRRQALTAVLAERLGRPLRRPAPGEGAPEPPVALLLEVDAEYRLRAEAGELRLIAPKRFNPEGEAWLPVLHTRADDWHFTALYSNTALAHRLGRTKDWVVIYFQEDHGPEGRCTVVTETHGPMAGQRVVRGREEESRAAHEGTGRGGT